MAITAASNLIYQPAPISEPIKHKEPKTSVIENEEDRFVLSPAYKQYLKSQSHYDDLRHKYDVENLTCDEYLEMCNILKDEGYLNAEQYEWVNSYEPYRTTSGFKGEFPEEIFNKLKAMADSHPDPRRLEKVIDYYAKRRDQGNPISYDTMLNLADPSITYEWIEPPRVTSTQHEDTVSDKKYNWIEVITERMAEVGKNPLIKQDFKDKYMKAATSIIDILNELKR